MMAQMRKDGRISDRALGAVVPTDEVGLKWDWGDWSDPNAEFYDDDSGESLDPDLVRKLVRKKWKK